MFLSKIWFILVALVASVATTVALVAPRSASRQLASAEAQSLDRAQYAAEQQLKNDAIRWIQSVAKLGRDAVIAETLENATRGNGESSVLNETIRGRLGSLVPDLDSRGIRVLAAVDGNGRVVGRIGEGENSRDAELVSGIEVVADALRGYMSDDVWGANGKLMRVAAAPVLSKAKDRVVGAIYVGLDTGDRMVELWRKNLGIDVAILLGGQVVSSSVPQGALGTLADRVKEHQDEIKGAHRTKAFTLPHGADELLAVAAPFTGQAAAMGAHYVLMLKQTQAGGPLELLSSTTKEDLGWPVFPWVRLGGAVLAIIGIGLFFQRRETEKPLKTLRLDVQKLARGEIQKLDDHQHPGRFGAIARDVNAALERFLHGDGAGDQRKDLSSIIGDKGGRSVDLPALPPLGSQGSTGGFGPQKTPGGLSGLTPGPSGFSNGPYAPPPNFGPPPGAAPGGMSRPAPSGPMPIPGAFPSARLSSPPMPGAPGQTPAGARPMAPLPAVPSAPQFGGYQQRPPNPTGDYSATYSQDATPTPTMPMQTASTGSMPAARGAVPSVQADDSSTANMNNAPVTGDPEEAHIRQVFSEYMATRAQTGESTKGLTIDKFRERLDENRKAIVAKYNCRGARFAVYVKDGKAAIRATPVKD
jgi:hypothetical protein